MKDNPNIRALVQAMHDTLGSCGEWCRGAEGDYQQFTYWVEDYWGSLTPLEGYLDGSTNHE